MPYTFLSHDSFSSFILAAKSSIEISLYYHYIMVGMFFFCCLSAFIEIFFVLCLICECIAGQDGKLDESGIVLGIQQASTEWLPS